MGEREKSPLIIDLLFLVVIALMFTIGNENETTKNQSIESDIDGIELKKIYERYKT